MKALYCKAKEKTFRQQNIIKESYSNSAECAGKCKHSKTFNSEKLWKIKNKLSKFMYYEIIYVLNVNISQNSIRYACCSCPRDFLLHPLSSGKSQTKISIISHHEKGKVLREKSNFFSGERNEKKIEKKDQKFVELYDGTRAPSIRVKVTFGHFSDELQHIFF